MCILLGKSVRNRVRLESERNKKNQQMCEGKESKTERRESVNFSASCVISLRLSTVTTTFSTQSLLILHSGKIG